MKIEGIQAICILDGWIPPPASFRVKRLLKGGASFRGTMKQNDYKIPNVGKYSAV
jgi:hypothetical protein